MLLTITTTHVPATELGYLLAKHPDRLQTFELSFGKAHVFYTESSDARCTVALMLDVDPVGLSRGHKSASGPPLEPYVNDRPYAASSFLSVAIAQVFGTALAARSDRSLSKHPFRCALICPASRVAAARPSFVRCSSHSATPSRPVVTHWTHSSRTGARARISR